MTRAPMTLPISTVASPVPPEAPSTASVSPGLSSARIAQRIERGAIGDGEARGAVEIERVGTLTRRFAGTATASRAAPQPVLPITRSPGATSVTPAPTLSTMPENSAAGENGNGGLC